MNGQVKETLINIGLGTVGMFGGGIAGAFGAVAGRQIYKANKAQADMAQINLDATKQNYYGTITGTVVDVNAD